jgi:hypothetical protein
MTQHCVLAQLQILKQDPDFETLPTITKGVIFANPNPKGGEWITQ